jgi:hypothetical protein
MKIEGLTVHKAITAEVVMEAVERHNVSLDDPGFCISCGFEQDGCEPDMRKGTCESCGEEAVYGAEELLLYFTF